MEKKPKRGPVKPAPTPVLATKSKPKKNKQDDLLNSKEREESFAAPQNDDGSLILASSGANFAPLVDLEGTVRNDAELVTKYRELSLQPEIEMAIDEITNEMLSFDTTQECVRLNLDSLEGYSDKIKERFKEEFEVCLRLMDFNNTGYDIIRRWYVDGRWYYHVIIDEQNPRAGIKELRYIDPRKIRKVKEVQKKVKGQLVTTKLKSEYFVYSERGYAPPPTTAEVGLDVAIGSQVGGVKITKDAIVYATSGLTDQWNRSVLSHLHKALRPMNQLRSVEDSTIIYRLARAPERRIFYIDVGNLPRVKAEQYVRELMNNHKNKLVYNSSTGAIHDDRKIMHMMEDYWFPRREGGKGTEVTTLPAGQNLGEMEDVEYFRRNLYRSLNVPSSRLTPNESGFNLGRSSEITREELKFQKFIDRLRLRFSMIFKEILRRQLLLKNVVAVEEVDDILDKIQIEFNRDNQFTELKEIEINRERNNMLREMNDFVGTYYSRHWLRKNVLKMDDELIAQMDAEMALDRDTMQQQQMNQQAIQGGEDAEPTEELPTDSSKETIDAQNKIKEKEAASFVWQDTKPEKTWVQKIFGWLPFFKEK